MIRSVLVSSGFMAALAVSGWSGSAHAEPTNPEPERETLTVVVNGVESADGVVRCAIFPVDEGFPMDAAEENRQFLAATPGTVTFVFDGLTPGTYAVAVSHAANDNGRTDTNFLGIPREAWGVSNNVRPSLRAPRFTEAAFELGDGQTTIEVDVR